jgi:subtilisin family serine protease
LRQLRPAALGRIAGAFGRFAALESLIGRRMVRRVNSTYNASVRKHFPPIAICLVLILVLTGRPSGTVRPAGAQAPDNYAPGRVLVGFQPGTNAQAGGRFSLPDAAQLAVPELGVYALQVSPGREVTAAAALRGQPGVAFAEPDYVASAVSALAAPVYPNDPDLGHQWGLARIGAPLAWSVITGTSGVMIAIVDSGVDLRHPDLAAKVWTSPGEIPNNSIDDDGDGKIDDVHGWHYYHSWAGTQIVPQEDNMVQDDYGHGTHVAGIAAAATNNNVGVAGLAWGAQILPVKVLDANGFGLYSEIANGILYAAGRGAHVINVSAGGHNYSEALCGAVAQARAQGSLVVAAAGNDAGAVLYPAACPGALAVAASDSADRRASFSNVGPELAVTAPGVDIFSTWYRSGIQASSYETLSGTSMAAPYVSGLGALIWNRWPGWGPAAVTYQITATAVDIEGPGWDRSTGWGRIDAGRAVSPPALPPRLVLPLLKLAPAP